MYEQFSRIRTQLKSQRSPLNLKNFSGGLVTSFPVQNLQTNELSECVNFKFSESGGLETRQGLTKYNSTTFSGNVVSMGHVSIDDVGYELFVCDDKHVYYLDSSSDPVLIPGTLNSTDVQIIEYNDVVIILDGGVIKYWNGTGDLKLAYDDGTGTRGYQFNNSSGTESGSTSLYSGSITRIAYEFTSTAFDSGWSIDPTKVTAKLAKTGSPTGNVEIKIRDTSDNSILATKTLVAATTVTSSVAEYDITFASGDITTSISGSKDYYCSIEYTGGDSGNCIKVYHTTVTDGGHYNSYSGSSWTASSTKDPIFSLKPGSAPKALFGDIKIGRLLVAGDSDNFGYVWYSNLTHLDWSTPAGGGYIGAVDDGANSFAVGAIMNLFGDLYVFGKENQPYLAKLTGSSPEDYALPSLFQSVSTTHKTVISTVNNLFFCSKDGVNSLRGVEQFGDLRTFSESSAIKDRINDYWDDDAFAGYDSIEGQYWLKLNGLSTTLVCHTKQMNQQTGKFPWVEYRFFKENLSDIGLYTWYESSIAGEFYVATASGTTTASGLDPNILDPAYLMFNDSEVTRETVGALINNTYGYGDNDSLGYDTVYVCLTELATVLDTNISTILEPTAFSFWGSKNFVAGNDGNVYYLDEAVTDDNFVNPRYVISTGYLTAPFAKVCLERYAISIVSRVGGELKLEIYLDSARNIPTISHTVVLSVSDSLIVDDVDLLVQDAKFTLGVSGRITKWVNVNCESFLFSFRDFTVNSKTIYFDDFLIETRSVGR